MSLRQTPLRERRKRLSKAYEALNKAILYLEEDADLRILANLRDKTELSYLRLCRQIMIEEASSTTEIDKAIAKIEKGVPR